MIVQRITWRIREGHSIEEAVAITKEFRWGPMVTRRFCSSWLSPKLLRIIGEFEYKDANDIFTEWDIWASSPDAAEWNEKFYAVCETTPEENEFWQVID
jgi:hypothetical protein